MTAHPLTQAPRTLVVIGGGQGGAAALGRILSALPRGFKAPILVSLGANDAVPAASDKALGHMHLKHIVARHLEFIRSGCIYRAPPAWHLFVAKVGQIGLVAPSELSHPGRPADSLFESAARIYGRNVIGLILSGDSDDGTNGMRAVHAAGGVGLVQSMADAEKSGMPMSALLGDHPDFITMLDNIPSIVARLTGVAGAKS